MKYFNAHDDLLFCCWRKSYKEIFSTQFWFFQQNSWRREKQKPMSCVNARMFEHDSPLLCSRQINSGLLLCVHDIPHTIISKTEFHSFVMTKTIKICGMKSNEVPFQEISITSPHNGNKWDKLGAKSSIILRA